MREAFRPVLLAVCLLSLSVIVPAASRAASLQQGTYAYGSHARQALDAYWATPEQGTQPGIVIVHGGYWNAGRKSDWNATAQWYAGQGFAVFAVDYRYNTDAAWPAPRDDVNNAITWVKNHAGTFNLDPDRIAIIGSQAGGHLAAQAGTHGAGNATVRGVVGLSAIASPKRAYDEAQTTAASSSRRKIRDQSVILANCTPARDTGPCLTRYTDLDTATHASSDDAPMLLIHSAGDTVPATHGTDVQNALAGAGVTDVTVQTESGTASGDTLLTDTMRAQTLTWIRTRTQPRTTPPPAAGAAEPTGLRAERVPARTSDDNGATTTTTQQPTTLAATRLEQTYSYGRHARHNLTAYYYKRSTKQPVIVLIHGGYWYEGDKSSWATQARYFADKGYAVFSVNYRLNTQATWHAQRYDIYNSIQWIKSKATTFTLNPARIVLLGSSAGGHLATSIGVYSTGTKYAKAVAALSPVASPYHAYLAGQTTTTTDQQRKLRDTATLLARCTPDRNDTTCWKRWTDMVSFNQASTGDTPMYLIHSTGDFVPPTHATQLCNTLKTKNVSCTTLTVSGTAHGNTLLNITGIRDKLLKWIQAHD